MTLFGWKKKSGSAKETLTVAQLNEACSQALFRVGLLEQQIDDMQKNKKRELHEANQLRDRFYAARNAEAKKAGQPTMGATPTPDPEAPVEPSTDDEGGTEGETPSEA
jgi:cysteinyl-tRNA synthetase